MRGTRGVFRALCLLAAAALLAGIIYMLVKPYREATKLTTKLS